MSRLLAALMLVAASLGFVSAAESPKSVVAREWKGRVPVAKADEYYGYLVEAGIKQLRAIPGSLGVEVLRRKDGDAVQFTVISYWVSREAIEAYAGKDIDKPHHLPKDAEYLLELPTRVIHYNVALA